MSSPPGPASAPGLGSPPSPAGAAELSLNLGSFLPRSRVNGPGERAVLWLQGCPLRCPGCYNPALLPVKDAARFPVGVVAEVIKAIPDIEGVTYSGGEPTMQAAALAALSETLHAAGLSVVCYTGHVYEHLLAGADPAVVALLRQVDLLIDGPFERGKAPGGRWRGSANQRLIALSERYRDLAGHAGQDLSDEREVEVIVADGAALWTGVFPAEIPRRVQALLADRSRPRAGTRRVAR